jgi:hypothetical protein
MIAYIHAPKDRDGVEPICRVLPIAPFTYYAASLSPPRREPSATPSSRLSSPGSPPSSLASTAPASSGGLCLCRLQLAVGAVVGWPAGRCWCLLNARVGLPLRRAFGRQVLEPSQIGGGPVLVRSMPGWSGYSDPPAWPRNGRWKRASIVPPRRPGQGATLRAIRQLPGCSPGSTWSASRSTRPAAANTALASMTSALTSQESGRVG